MDEQRIKDYLNLIQQLLNCPSGGEAEILRQNHHLIDRGLLGVMESVAEMMEREGEPNAQRLRSLAAQLAELISQWERLNEKVIELYGQGKFAEAIPLAEQALEFIRSLHPGDHLDVATSLNNLATLYYFQGRYEQVKPFYEEALEMRKRLFKGDHPDVAMSLNNLAELYHFQGRYEQAKPFYEEALEMRKRLFTDDHPDVAMSLNNLAGLYYSEGRYEQAEPLHQEALEMRKRLFKDDHPDVVMSLNNLAGLYKSYGQYQQAEPLYQQALEIRKRLYTGDHPSVATSLNNLAALYYSQGRYQQAEPLYQEALAMYKRLLSDHPNVVDTLKNLAILLAATDRPQEALTHIKEAMEVEYNIMRRVFAASSEKDRLRFLDSIRPTLETLLSLVWQQLRDSPEAVRFALDAVLKRKNLSAAALAAFNYALYSDRYRHLAADFQELRSINTQILELTFSPPLPTPEMTAPQFQAEQAAHQQKLSHLEEQRDKLEKQLAAQVPEIQLQEQPSDRRAVALELPEGSVLLEFVCFDRFDFQAQQWQPSRYLAFVLPAQQPDAVQMIDLGEAEPIDRLIRIFRESAATPFGDVLGMTRKKSATPNKSAAIALQELLYNRIRHTLQGYNHLILAPDGNLNLLPFQLLPTDDTGKRLLMDEYRISYLSVGRDILRSQIQPSRPATAPLVMADPDFDWGSREPAKAHFDSAQCPVAERSRSAGFACVDAVSTAPSLSPEVLTGQSPFRRAPGTRFLGERVAKTLNVTPYLGSDALEPHLTKARSPRIMLLATHGVFLPDSEEKLPNCDRPLFDMSDRFSTAKADNPMMRSGLALAGANLWLSGDSLPPEAGKGFLFAQDIAILDLWATELTVLSACNTAMGDVKIGEGVFGMRRAFAVAGCKTLVMSLWPVPDKATALLMERFFENLRAGLGRTDALQDAQNYIRTVTIQALRESVLGMEVLGELESGNVLVDRDYRTPLAHPFYWGAWVCQGEITPMEMNELSI